MLVLLFDIDMAMLTDMINVILCVLQVTDLLDAFPSFKTFDHNGLKANIAFFHSKDLQPEVVEWMLSICKENMKARLNPPAIIGKVCCSRCMYIAAHCLYRRCMRLSGVGVIKRNSRN